MFLFESISYQSLIMWILVIFVLIFFNEISRLSKYVSIFFYIVLPIILTIFVWPTTTKTNPSVNTWFHWAKVYSALAGCIGFMAIRYIKNWDKNKYLLMFPPFILSLNILEAVIRDFQLTNVNGIVDGVTMVGGSWHIMNGIAGILNIVTLSGWAGIYISKGKTRDMIWPDMKWFWIIAYDLWNFAYVYNCVSNHAFYAGAALLISCTIPAFFIKKGAWLQHRAQTLALWMMFVMCFPNFVDSSKFAVKSSNSPSALFMVSFISILFNLIVFIYHFYYISKKHVNPLKNEVYIVD